jgi:pyruvate/2-oxoglutarate/acetoin dehydrogenase E1 component
MVPTALAASEICKTHNIRCEEIDLCSLVPLDVETILESVKKTARAVIVSEAPKTMSFAAELSAILAEHVLEYLKAPIVRVTGLDTPVPYALDHLYVPTKERVVSAAKKVMTF